MSERAVRRVRRGWLILIVLALALVHQLYLTRAQPDAPYMDTLRVLHQLEQWHAGDMSLLELWGQNSSHRGLINQALLAANVEWFSLDVFLANRLTGLVMLLMALLLVKQASDDLRRIPNAGLSNMLLRLLVPGLIAVLVFSWAGFEVLTLDLGLPLWLKNFFIVAYCSIHARYLADAVAGRVPARWRVILLSLLPMLLLLLVTMGWSYAFAGAVLAVHMLGMWLAWQRQRRLPRGFWQIPAAFAFALALYLLPGQGIGDGVSLSGSLELVPHALALLPYALSSAWMGLETAQAHHVPMWVLQLAGMATILGGVAGLASRLRRDPFDGSLLPYYLIIYSGLTALSVGIARGEAGPEQVMASRYYMDLMLGLIGAVWISAREYTSLRTSRYRVAVLLTLLWTGSIFVMQGMTYQREWRAAPYRAASFVAMNNALIAGVPDEAAARLLQAPLAHARQGVVVMRRRGLGVMGADRAAAQTVECDIGAIRQAKGWHVREGASIWMSKRASLMIPRCKCPFTTTLYLPADFPPRILEVTDATASGQTARFALRPGTTMTLALGTSAADRLLELRVSAVTVPASDLPGGIDQRALGALWSAPAYACP